MFSDPSSFTISLDITIGMSRCNRYKFNYHWSLSSQTRKDGQEIEKRVYYANPRTSEDTFLACPFLSLVTSSTG